MLNIEIQKYFNSVIITICFPIVYRTCTNGNLNIYTSIYFNYELQRQVVET